MDQCAPFLQFHLSQNKKSKHDWMPITLCWLVTGCWTSWLSEKITCLPFYCFYSVFKYNWIPFCSLLLAESLTRIRLIISFCMAVLTEYIPKTSYCSCDDYEYVLKMNLRYCVLRFILLNLYITWSPVLKLT